MCLEAGGNRCGHGLSNVMNGERERGEGREEGGEGRGERGGWRGEGDPPLYDRDTRLFVF